MKLTMNYTEAYNDTLTKKKRLVLPWLIILITLLMIPLGGTNYLQILFVCFAFFIVMFEKTNEIRINDANLNIYTRYFVIFMYISVIVGLMSGVDLRTELADILTSALPYICLVIGSYYATKYEESNYIKLFAGILIIEFLMGLGQNVSESFRNLTFAIYDTQSRLLSYEAEDVGRAVGTLRSPNYYGLICVILGMIFIGLLFDKKERIRRIKGVYNLALIFLTLASVILSVSKTSVICIFAVFILCAFFSSSLRGSSKFLILIVCIIAVVVLIPQFEAYSNRQIDISSMSGRNDNWERIIRLGFSKTPGRIILGYGNGYSTVKFLGIYADSYYIILLFEQGLVGVIAYFITWLSILATTLKRRPSIYRTYTICLICVMLMSDVTAAVTDMPILCIIIYYLIGRYSTLSVCVDEMISWEEGK